VTYTSISNVLVQPCWSDATTAKIWNLQNFYQFLSSPKSGNIWICSSATWRWPQSLKWHSFDLEHMTNGKRMILSVCLSVRGHHCIFTEINSQICSWRFDCLLKNELCINCVNMTWLVNMTSEWSLTGRYFDALHNSGLGLHPHQLSCDKNLELIISLIKRNNSGNAHILFGLFSKNWY